ncbi:MAG: hypothetical protein A2V88_17970 [Elusimicrobia bacterium RBG_16_66_12]|nr:MAG: hypothetical protein A2V88_17970 [Elusimicrobia bacterium RBG_16_66_12]
MKSTFVSRYAGYFVLFLVIEQAIVASSTFWLAWLAKGIIDNGPLMLPFIGFTCSLTLVYIPSILKNTYLSKAKIRSLELYIDTCSKGLQCVPHLSRSTVFQREKRNAIETESFLVIGETFDFANLSLGLILNVIFNVSALCIAFGSHLLWAYILAAAIGVALTAGSAKRVRSDSAAMQEARTGAHGALPGAWDAITLGNDYNRELWRNDFGRKMGAYLSKASMSVRNIEILTSLTLWVSVLPVIAVMAHAMFSKHSDAAMKAMILATFPRQIQVIQYTADIVNCLLNLSAVRERLAGLFRASMVDPDPNGMTGKIQQERISCVDAAGRRVELEGLTPPEAGRLTIRGENGSGKSSFLLELKRRHPKDSIILPAHHRLHFASVAEADVSTGQKLSLILEELCDVEPLKLLLLDEWDANLDQENMQRIDAAISRLAQRCCVVEVRHR